MPPSRKASGVEPPATNATPVTLSSMAIPGAITDTEMAMASQSRSEPCASSPLPAPGIRSGLVLAMAPFLSFGHQDGLAVQVVVKGQRSAVTCVEPGEEVLVDRVRPVLRQGLLAGELGVEQVGVAAGAGPGEIGAEPAPGHQPDLRGPGRHHRAHVRGFRRGQLAGEAEQDDVLHGHEGWLPGQKNSKYSRISQSVTSPGSAGGLSASAASY